MNVADDRLWDDRAWSTVYKGGLMQQCPKCLWWTSNKNEHMNGPIACQFSSVPIKYLESKGLN